MMYRRRRILSFIITFIMVITIQAPLAFAEEAEAGSGSDASVINGFAPLARSEYYFEGKPEEKELTAALPKTIGVRLNADEGTTQIPVHWEIAEDYGKTDFYFYSARPVWSDEYKLPEGLDPELDVPWVTLFRQSSEEELKEGEETINIPADDPQALPLIGKGAAKGGEKAAGKGVSSSDVKKIYNYLTDTMGLNMAAACGVMTNLYAESGMQSNNLENTYNARYGLSDSEYTKRVNKGKKNNGKYTSGFGKTRYFTTDYSGYGICQWTTSGRRKKVLKAAVKKDVSVANLKMQLGVLKSELENSYPQVLATLRGVPNSAAGVYLSAAHFCAAFEIPANTNATAASRARTALSTYWKTYSGKSASAKGKSYLGLCGYSYPKSVKKGVGVTVSGHVISNYTIKSVKTKILDGKGKAVYSKTKKPGSAIYSLYHFDGSMKFSKLSPGDYTYVISAKDSHGKSVTVKHAFSVKKDGSTKTARGCATKDVSVPKGKSKKK